MCKIFTLTNTSKIKSLNKFINTVAAELSSYERDGFGYAIQGDKGLFGERSLRAQTFKTAFKRPMLSLPFVTAQYNRFGKHGKPVGAGIFHGRTSTNQKTLINTHPIQRDNWTLIHNGVVTDHGPKYEMLTTNDTEHLVKHLSTGGIDAVAEHLTGYYAVSAFSPEGSLIIFRDSTASLFVAEITSIDSFVFCTSEAIIRDVCTAMKWKYSTIEPMQANTYLVLQGNALLEQKTFTPRGFGESESKYASASLGRSISTAYDNEGWPDATAWESHSPVTVLKPVTEIESSVPNTDDTETYSQEQFLAEISLHFDSSYEVRDYRGEPVDHEYFLALGDDEKLEYTVIRSDGTIVDPVNYAEERIYQGAV